eukprot:SAG31_NODE_31037_length_373_cov_0.744526_1_plen_42_part_01
MVVTTQEENHDPFATAQRRPLAQSQQLGLGTKLAYAVGGVGG